MQVFKYVSILLTSLHIYEYLPILADLIFTQR